MNDLERRALLGDAEAQRECTEKGIVLACPFCGGSALSFMFMNGSQFLAREAAAAALAKEARP